MRKRIITALTLLMLTVSIQGLFADILFNGDFEYALGGWSYGSWWGGKYEFTVVEEPYTGEYSVKIECFEIGTEAKSLLNTDFSAEIGQVYTLSFWHKGSLEGTQGRVYISGVDGAILDFSTGTDWQQTTLTFTAASDKHGLSFYHIGEAKTSLYFDHILINAGDRALDVPPVEEVFQGIPSQVTVGDYVTMFNGCPIFPVSAYSVDSPETAKEAGFNCLIDLFSATDFAYLNRAFDLGLPVIGGGMTGLLRSHFPEKAGEYAEIYKNHPAIFAHYMIDEPDHDWWYVPPAELTAASEAIHAVDPNHPTMMLQMRWSIGATFNGRNYYNYSQSSDIFACDPYVVQEGAPISQLRTTMNSIRFFIGNKVKPVWYAVEGGWDDKRELTRAEQYGVAWTSIANNVNGLFFFEYQFLKKHPAQLQAALDITKEIRHLEGALTSPVVSLPERVDSVDWYSRRSPGGLVIFAANTSDESKIGVTISHPEISASASVSDAFDKRDIVAAEGFITDDFAPYERHVYVINAKPHFCLEYPGNGISDMHPRTMIRAMAIDELSGIDADSIIMTVNGDTVSPEIIADDFGGVQLSFNPPAALSGTVEVAVTAKNTAGESISTDWSFSVDSTTGIEEGGDGQSETPDATIMLGKNYPNPFNPRTSIDYMLTQAAPVMLTVHNAGGQHVTTLKNEQQLPGRYSAVWDASDMPSGIYFMRLQSGEQRMSRKMLLVK